jgi:hypothetical protein
MRSTLCTSTLHEAMIADSPNTGVEREEGTDIDGFLDSSSLAFVTPSIHPAGTSSNWERTSCQHYIATFDRYQTSLQCSKQVAD